MLSWVAPVAVSLLLATVVGLLLLGSPGMVVLPWRTSTYGSNPSSIGHFGSGELCSVCCEPKDLLPGFLSACKQLFVASCMCCAVVDQGVCCVFSI